MNKKLYFVTICAVVLTVIGIIGMFSPKRTATAALSLDAPEAVKIKRVIQKAYAIDVEAAASFDLSQFSSVYVNDPRGGALGVGWLKVVQNDWQQTNDSRLNDPSYTPGYLDYKLAYYSLWKRGAENIESAWAKANQENRSLKAEEVKSLIDANTGQLPSARGEVSAKAPDIVFELITIDGDTATAVIDDGPRTMEMTLVNINGRWFIAGAKIMEIHF